MRPFQFRRDELLVHRLDVSSGKPIDELAPVPFPIGSSSIVFGVYLLTVGGDLSFVTDQPNSFLEGCACDRKGKVLNVAYVDEVVRIPLEIRIDPISSTEALFRREVLRESKGDVDIGRVVRLPRTREPNRIAKRTSVSARYRRIAATSTPSIADPS